MEKLQQYGRVRPRLNLRPVDGGAYVLADEHAKQVQTLEVALDFCLGHSQCFCPDCAVLAKELLSAIRAVTDGPTRLYELEQITKHCNRLQGEVDTLTQHQVQQAIKIQELRKSLEDSRATIRILTAMD